ncbi:MAG: hypothetical protein WAV15_03655 [Minisyncoccia bacterium]
MDIKDLNKSQLILLAVLLSFITSIATGITTVTLMQQAPASFTVPVNRVIQQTVEKIQQVEGKTTIQTVIVKEEDLVVDAISKNSSSVFSITKDGTDAEFNKAEVSAGKGFAVTKSGVIVVDASQVPSNATNYYASNSSGKFKADFISTDKSGFSFLKIGAPVDGAAKLEFSVPSFADLEKMKAGQKVIIFGNSISSTIYEGNKTLSTNVSKVSAGGAVLDLDGNILGIALFNETTNFAPIKVISEVLATLSVS